MDRTTLLVAVGQALYGAQWQSPLARDLGVAIRTVQRWAAGEYAPAAGVYADLLRLVEERAGTLRGYIEPLREAAGK